MVNDNQLLLKKFINDAKLEKYSSMCEFWDIVESSQKLSYLTHNFFRYFGKFPSKIPKNLISLYTKKENDIVVDTMVGSGTTLVECLINKRKGIGFDINPFSVLLSKVKITKIDVNILDYYFSNIKKGFRKMNENDTNHLIPDMKNVDHWFDKKVQKELSEIKYLINEIEDNKVKDFFWVCFASILRRVSNAGSQTGRIFFDKNWKYRDPYELFEKQYESMRERIKILNRLNYPDIEVRIGNAKKLNLQDSFADLVICHPPYYNLYKFSHTNNFEMAWLDIDINYVRKNEIFEGFKLGSFEKHVLYLDELYKIINEMSRIMKLTGKGALMIGDTIIKGHRLYIANQIIKYIEKYFNLEKIILRRPRFSEAYYATSQRRSKYELGHNLTDFIIIFGKKNE
jgi:DNA modification methylase